MKPLFTALIMGATLFSAGAQSFNAHFGMDYFDGAPYIAFGGAFLSPVGEDTEFELGLDFSLKTRDSNGEVVADFLVPVNIGLSFIFPTHPSLDFLVGIGLEPTMYSIANDETRFYVGPYIKTGVRVQIHSSMKWFIEAQESLLIGPPNWLNPKTTVVSGFNFTF